MRTPRRVAIRLPAGVQPAEARTLLDGADVPAGWRGSYAVFDELMAGQVAAIAYPLREFSRSYRIAGVEYQGQWRGSTMLEIQPAGERYPIYRRRALVEEPVPAVSRGDLTRPPSKPMRALW